MNRSAQDTASNLALRLRQAGSDELLQWIGDHGRELGLREVRLILLNAHCNGEVIEELAYHRQLLSDHQVRRALARHPRTPQAVAMRLIPNLFWRDLLEISTEIRIRVPVRQVAEKYLLQRLARLSAGERINLARRAPPTVAAELGQEPSLRVMQALLGNPRLTEEVVLGWISRPSRKAKTLNLIAQEPRWGRRYEVRLALCRNPNTPLQVQLDLLPTLHRQDLELIASVSDQSILVLNRVEDLLAEGVDPSIREL